MINVGPGNIQAIKVGSEDASMAYLGSTLVWTAEGPIYTALTCVYQVTVTGETKIAHAMATACTSMTVDGVDVTPADTFVFDRVGTHKVKWEMVNSDMPNFAFMETNALRVVHIPSTMLSIGIAAFYHNTGLTNCDMSGTAIWAIQAEAFEGCSSLEEIKLPPCTRINVYTFSGCTNVTSITFTDTITRIDNGAFDGVGELSHGAHEIELIMPSGLTYIGEAAFAHVKTDVIELNEGLETIGPEAFFGADESSIDIPSTVTSIGYDAFGQCPLMDIKFKGSTPPTFDGDPFLHDHLYHIRVPSGSLAAYQAALPSYASLMVEY